MSKSNYHYDPELGGDRFVGVSGVAGNIPPSIINHKPSRSVFINQVLNYVSIQLLITAVISGFMYKNRESVIESFNNDPGLFWFPVIMTFISLICMFLKCCQKIMFLVFTISCSIMVGTTVLQYAPQIVFMAVITTMFIVWIINGYSYWCVKHNKSLSFMEPFLGTGLCMLIIIGILNIFIQSSFIHLVITAFGVILFTGYLLFDLNRLYDNGDDDHLQDPMLAAVAIYLDIINLFIYLLELYDKIFGKSRAR